jgi:hypothetical protein
MAIYLSTSESEPSNFAVLLFNHATAYRTAAPTSIRADETRTPCQSDTTPSDQPVGAGETHRNERGVHSGDHACEVA